MRKQFQMATLLGSFSVLCSFAVAASLAVLAPLVLLPLPCLAQSQGAISVHVTGLKNSTGLVRVALFNSASSYETSRKSDDCAGGAFRKGSAKIANNSATVTFESVPYGEYAVKMFHDEDESGKFVTGMFGIPKVEYGFSNNARGKMGPAPYDKAKFSLDKPELSLDINP